MLGPNRAMFASFLNIECAVQHTMTSPCVFGALWDACGGGGGKRDRSNCRGKADRKPRARCVAFARRCTVCTWGRGNNSRCKKERNMRQGKNDRNMRSQRRLPHSCSACCGTHAGERVLETEVGAKRIEALVGARQIERRVLDASRLRGAARYALEVEGE